jgi:hypothetical protein
MIPWFFCHLPSYYVLTCIPQKYMLKS